MLANSEGSSNIGLSGDAKDEPDGKAYDLERVARAGRTDIEPRLVLASPESLISPSPEEEDRSLERPSSLQYDTPPRVLENIADQEEVPPPSLDHMDDII